MTDAGTTYIVSVYDSLAKVRKTLLVTGDKAEADAIVAAMEQDGVRAGIETIVPRRKR
jgi:hypothetical protein